MSKRKRQSAEGIGAARDRYHELLIVMYETCQDRGLIFAEVMKQVVRRWLDENGVELEHQDENDAE